MRYKSFSVDFTYHPVWLQDASLIRYIDTLDLPSRRVLELKVFSPYTGLVGNKGELLVILR